MDRTEKIGLGVAVAGHALLFGVLSLGFLKPPVPVKVDQQPVEVSLVPDVALEAVAPATTPPAPSVAPDLGQPEDAAPPAEAAPEPEPKPEPLPPTPAPAPQPKPAPPKPAPPKPAPAPVPVPKPVPVKPRPTPPAPQQSAAKPAPAKTVAHAAPAKPSPAKSVAQAAPAKAAPAKAPGRGTDPAKTAARPRGGRLGDNFLAGLSSEPTKSVSTAPSAAKAGPFPTASIQQAIARQIQPCADRQVNPGPGANQIVTTLNIRLNQDGTLSATPRMVRQSGVDGDNDRYAQRVVDLGIAAFKGCAPLKLPAQYYATANGGWGNINYQWQLR